jgi:hypothetical protein
MPFLFEEPDPATRPWRRAATAAWCRKCVRPPETVDASDRHSLTFSGTQLNHWMLALTSISDINIA